MKPSSLSALLAPAALVCAVAPAAVAAAADEPAELMRTATDEVLKVAYEAAKTTDGAPLSDRVRPVLEKYFAFDAVTRRAVGPQWRQFTPQQQQRAIEHFTDRVIRTYVDRFQITEERPEVTFGRAVVLSDTKCEIPSGITYQGSRFAVAYRLEKFAAGWRIYDVGIEGVSMVSNYRGQFEALLQKGGPEELLRVLATQPLPEVSGSRRP